MSEAVRNLVRAHAWVSGRVQGVAYRAFARQAALHWKLTGGVRNLEDGRVEVVVEGARPDVDAFFGELKQGPPTAFVTDIQIQWKPIMGQDIDFVIWY